ncbi:BspA family leucine-rich repeat surface protein [Microbacterium sp.]|uniref:BspA family leucine-rich repeat surface protein n=1 Tax=Microbacterium sp. TaxID=51671 RepID=UPI0035C760B2
MGAAVGWKTTSATKVQRMFNGASAFAQDLSHFYVGALYDAEKNVLDFAPGSELTVAQLPKFTL